MTQNEIGWFLLGFSTGGIFVLFVLQWIGSYRSRLGQ